VSSSTEKSDGKKLVVLGAGPGGYPAAFRAADLGFDVTLIDPRPDPGGVCLFEGCIPSKLLLHAARLIQECREAESWGLHFPKPKIDIDRLRDFKESVVEKLGRGVAGTAKQRGVERIRGSAAFADAHTLAITDPESGDKEEIRFDTAIIATGSRPVALPDVDVERNAVWDSAEALKLSEIPRTLLVMGGGYIGLEMGTIYQALGSQVTVVELTGDLLPGVDPELVEPLRKRLEGSGPGGFDEILTHTRMTGLEPYEHGVSVELTDREGDRKTRKFARVLVAVGREPQTDGLGLENTRIETDSRGFIVVDGQRRTAESHIFAVGDAAGEPMLAHKASREGHVAAEAAADRPAGFDPAAIPAVVFTDPEIAWTGLTEDEARERGVKVRIARFPWKASGRALATGRPEGLTKLVIDPRSERVLGVGITGVNAGELIAGATLAVEMGSRAGDLADTIHPHPTFSESLMEAAAGYLGRSPHHRE